MRIGGDGHQRLLYALAFSCKIRKYGSGKSFLHK